MDNELKNFRVQCLDLLCPLKTLYRLQARYMILTPKRDHIIRSLMSSVQILNITDIRGESSDYRDCNATQPIECRRGRITKLRSYVSTARDSSTRSYVRYRPRIESYLEPFRNRQPKLTHK